MSIINKFTPGTIVFQSQYSYLKLSHSRVLRTDNIGMFITYDTLSDVYLNIRSKNSDYMRLVNNSMIIEYCQFRSNDL